MDNKINYNNCNGITLLEIIIAFVFILIVIVCSIFAGNRYGYLGFLIVIAVVVSIFALSWIWDTIYLRWIIPTPNLPTCIKGKCNENEYAVEYDKKKIDFIYTCRCGDKYFMKRRILMKISAEGIETPYMKWIPFRGWFNLNNKG
jgi:heme/copper-type cytochrome/quinol oxidase subunit 2